MIRNWFVFIFAACLTGISLDGRNSAYGYTAYDYLDDYEDDGEFRGLHETLGPINTTTTSSTASKVSTSTSKADLTKGTKTTAAGAATEMTPHKNKTDSKLQNIAFKITLRYLVYKRGYREVIEDENFPEVDPNKDTYYLIPGYFDHGNKHYTTEEYQREFLTSVGYALLYYCNCNIVGVRWKISVELRRKELPIKAAILTGKRLGKHIYEVARKGGFKKPVSIISHNLGNVAATAITDIARRPVKYVYALDQIALPAPFRHFYIREDSSYLVQTLTTGGFKRNYGHRNFYPNGGNYSSHENQCFYCQSYRLFSDNIRNSGNNHQATFCSTYGAYVENLCDYFQEVSYFNRISPEALPYGNYFITEDSLSQ